VDQYVVLCFTYTPVFTVRLILEREQFRAERMRANEQSVIGGKPTLHILPPSA